MTGKSTSRRLVFIALALAALPLVLGQSRESAARGATLDEMLARALESNPEVELAEAKLRAAQAVLNQARLKVTQDVVAVYYELRSLELIARERQGALQRARTLVKAGSVQDSAVSEARLALADVEATSAQKRAALDYLLGVGGAVAPGAKPANQAPPRSRPERPAVPEVFKSTLERKIAVNFQDTPWDEAMRFLQEVSAMNFVLHPDLFEEDRMISLQLVAASLHDVFLAVADTSDLCFVVRDYGIFVVGRDLVEEISGPTIPAGLPYEGD